MQLRPRHLVLALGLAVAAAGMAGCRSLLSQRPPTPAALRIGTMAESPPMAFRLKGRWTGLEIDLGRALAERLDMKPVFVALPPDQLAPALLEGRVDILMAGLSITEERRVQMDFSTPYLVVGQTALLRTADRLRYTTEIKIRAASGRVGAVTGSTGDRHASRYFTQATRVEFPSAGNAVEALLHDQIDLLVHDAPALWWLAQHQNGLALAPVLFAREEVAWGFRRGSVTLRESANAALAQWQGDGTLETILNKWIPVSK